MADIETRIERLLDQLEDPNITGGDIELIKAKIELLKSQQS